MTKTINQTKLVTTTLGKSGVPKAGSVVSKSKSRMKTLLVEKFNKFMYIKQKIVYTCKTLQQIIQYRYLYSRWYSYP